jgi:hypothetical protein
MVTQGSACSASVTSQDEDPCGKIPIIPDRKIETTDLTELPDFFDSIFAHFAFFCG